MQLPLIVGQNIVQCGRLNQYIYICIICITCYLRFYIVVSIVYFKYIRSDHPPLYLSATSFPRLSNSAAEKSSNICDIPFKLHRQCMHRQCIHRPQTGRLTHKLNCHLG